MTPRFSNIPAKLLALLLACCAASPLMGQVTSATDPTSAACGPDTKIPKVKNVHNSDVPTTTPGQATIVYLEDQANLRPGHDTCPACGLNTALGMDGKWVAYTKTFSHVIFSVPPGEHHFCAQTLSSSFAWGGLPAFTSIHLEAGKTYYLSAEILPLSPTASRLALSEINPDEGRFLLSLTPRTEVVH